MKPSEPTVDPKELIESHREFVVGIAVKLRSQLHLPCDLEDLVALGFQGLLEANQRFKQTLSVPFRAFAYYRVRGAMLDGVRKMTPLSPRAHAHFRAMLAQDEIAQTQASTDTPPGERRDEQALQAIAGSLTHLATAFLLAHQTSEQSDDHSSPEASLISVQNRKHVQTLVEDLPEPDRTVVRCFYFDGISLERLATELGLSKSWVSRIHHRALEKLRKAFETEA